jgi:hypothetical protein
MTGITPGLYASKPDYIKSLAGFVRSRPVHRSTLRRIHEEKKGDAPYHACSTARYGMSTSASLALSLIQEVHVVGGNCRHGTAPSLPHERLRNVAFILSPTKARATGGAAG